MPSQDRLDGLTVDFDDWWFNLRPSNTEPLLRLNVRSGETVAGLCAARTAEVARARSAACVRPARNLNEAAGSAREPAPSSRTRRRSAVALDPKLLEILACPEDKGPLLYFEDESSLYNPRLQRRYAVRDDIPIMLIDEAETVDDAEHDRLLAKAEADGIRRRSRPIGRAAMASTRSAMLESLRGLPEQLAAAHEGRGAHRTSRRCRAPTTSTTSSFCGMGGSGIVGDVARHGGHRARCPCPIVVLKQYRTPAFVGPRTLVVRGLVLRRHGGDRRDGAGRARRRRAAGRALLRR